MGAAEDRESALGLKLSEAAVLGGDDDVCGEHHLDTDGESDALNRHHDWLGATPAEPERIDSVVSRRARSGLAGLHRGSKARQIEPCCRVGTGEAEDPDPKVRVLIEVS